MLPKLDRARACAARVVTNVVTGTDATAITFGDDENEMKKLLFSALLANDQVIVFDNLTRPLEGAALNTVLTEASWEERVLGESRTATVPTNALFLASGNNLQINGDMHPENHRRAHRRR